MHHLPAGPPPSGRVRAALARLALALRGVLPRRLRPALPILFVGLTTGLLALAVPVMSGALGRSSVSLDASSSATAHAPAQGGSPVVMGVDGRPVAPGTAGSGTRSMEATPGASPASTGATVDTTTDPLPPAATTGRTADAGTTAPSSSATSTSSSSSSATSSSTSASSPAPSSSSSASPSSAPAPVAVPGAEDAVLAAVNAARAELPCAALVADPSLVAAARENSLAMATRGTLAAPDAGAAAIDQGDPDAASAVAAWLTEPTVKARLLDCGLTSAGAAEVTGDGGPWWTLLLA